MKDSETAEIVLSWVILWAHDNQTSQAEMSEGGMEVIPADFILFNI